jgi:hypothetical protein
MNMKTKKLFFLLTAFVILSFAACEGSFIDPGLVDSPGGGNIPGGGISGGGNGGTIITNSDGSSAISNVQVKYMTLQDAQQYVNKEGSLSSSSLPNYTGTNDFSYLDNNTHDIVTKYVPGSSIKVTNGKLNMTLGIPKDEYLMNIQPVSGITATPSDAKAFYSGSEGFLTSDNKSAIMCFKSMSEDVALQAALFYVNKDVTLKGTGTNLGRTLTYDCSFKKGWNYMIVEGNNTTKTGTAKSSQTLPSGYNWVVIQQ